MRILRISSLVMFSLFLMIGFQNCSKVEFQAASDQAKNSCTGSTCNDSSNTNRLPGNPTEEEIRQQVKAVFNLGLMTRNLACAMCHLDVHGDISGFGTLTFRNDADGNVLGNIFGADQKIQHWVSNGTKYVLNQNVVDNVTDPNRVAAVLPELVSFNLDQNSAGIFIKKGEQHNIFPASLTFQGGGGLFTMTDNTASKRDKAAANLVYNPFTKKPVVQASEFPNLDLGICRAQAKGTITTGNGQILRSPLNGNQVLLHGAKVADLTIQQNDLYDKNCPSSKTFRVDGDVVIEGDVVLGGCFTGQGTILATGNIYVPDDIKMKDSAFPYSRTSDQNVLKNEALARANKDMLSIGSNGFVIVGAIRMEVIGHEEQDPIFKAKEAEIKRLYTWLDASPSNAQTIYESKMLKKGYKRLKSESGFGSAQTGVVALLETNIYANQGVAVTLTGQWSSNIVINGSVITPNLSMLSAGYNKVHGDLSGNTITVNPFNGVNFSTSQINQDFRLKYTELGFQCHRVRVF